MTGEVWVLGSLSPMNSYISTKQLIKFGKQTIVDKLGKFLCVEGHSHDLPLSVRVSIPDFPKSAENYRNMRYATGRLEQLGEELKLGPVVVFDDSYGSGLSMIMVLEALRQLGYEEWFHNIHPIALVKEQK